MLPSPCQNKVGTPNAFVSELDTRPTFSPTNASAAVSPPPPHSSGPGWFAKPFPYDSFIRNSMPVYPGAFSDPKRLHQEHCAGVGHPDVADSQERFKSSTGVQIHGCSSGTEMATVV
jgi:hypothetical protein